MIFVLFWVCQRLFEGVCDIVLHVQFHFVILFHSIWGPLRCLLHCSGSSLPWIIILSPMPSFREIRCMLKSMKYFHMSVVNLLFRNSEFWKFAFLSTTCSTCSLLVQIRSIATSLLNITSSGGMVPMNRNGGSEKFEHDEQFWELFSSSVFTLVLAFSGWALLKRMYVFPVYWCIKCSLSFRSYCFVWQQLNGVSSCWMYARPYWKLFGIFHCCSLNFKDIFSKSMQSPNSCRKSEQISKENLMETMYVVESMNDPSVMVIRAIKLPVLLWFPLPKQNVCALGFCFLVVSMCVLYSWDCFHRQKFCRHRNLGCNRENWCYCFARPVEEFFLGAALSGVWWGSKFRRWYCNLYFYWHYYSTWSVWCPCHCLTGLFE